MTTTTTSRTDEARWRAALVRDARADGEFVIAVRTTGVYCRPSCPAKRPKRENVRFYKTPAEAERAGFRACKRCKPQVERFEPQVDLVARVCHHIDTHLDLSLTLARLAEVANVSPHHLQRTFKRLIGISPGQYVKSRRVASLRRELRNGHSVTSAMYDAGYGSSSRLYEGASGELGMTPATYRKGGRGMTIGYTIVDCYLGRLLVAATERGTCAVSIGNNDAVLEATLHADFPTATIARDDRGLAANVEAVLAYLDGREPDGALPLDTQATAFQRQVWEQLQAIPLGETRSYGEIASAIGKPKAARAVGRACATNPVPIVVPCHRAVGGDGTLTGYRWGTDIKRALIEHEREIAEGRDA